MSNEDRTYKIGEVYFMEINGTCNEQRGFRPCVIFQNNVGNAHSPNIVALPLTTALKRTEMPTHVVLPAKDTGLPKDSMVLCENPVCVSKTKIGNYITTLSNDYMKKIAEGNIYASSAIAFIDPAIMMVLWEKALRLNSKGSTT